MKEVATIVKLTVLSKGPEIKEILVLRLASNPVTNKKKEDGIM